MHWVINLILLSNISYKKNYFDVLNRSLIHYDLNPVVLFLLLFSVPLLGQCYAY